MDKRQPCIYKITNTVNGKVYVGQTKIGLKVREYAHRNELKSGRHRNVHMKKDYEVFGLESFIFEIIQICDVCELEMLERKWIEHFNSTDRLFGYNIENGGNKGKKLAKETIDKINKNKDFSKVSRGNNKRARKIICVNDGNVFNCIKDAAEYYKVSYSGCMRVASGSRNASFSEDGNWYQFSYYVEGEECEIKPLVKNKPSKKKMVKCLNTNEIFSSIREASKATGIYRSFITSICNGELEEREGMKFEYIYE